MIFDLLANFKDAIFWMPKTDPRQQLQLVQEAIFRNADFLQDYPTSLFQTLWHDLRRGKIHSSEPNGAHAPDSPSLGPVEPSSNHVSNWLQCKHRVHEGFYWLHSMVPEQPQPQATIITTLDTDALDSQAACLTEDGRFLVVGRRFLDTSSLQQRELHAISTTCKAISFSSCGSIIIAADEVGNIVVVESNTGIEMQRIQSGLNDISSIRIADDPQTIYAISEHYIWRCERTTGNYSYTWQPRDHSPLWRKVRAGKIFAQHYDLHSQCIKFCSLLNDGNVAVYVFSCPDDGESAVELTPMHPDYKDYDFGGVVSSTCAAFSGDGGTLVLGTIAGTVECYRIEQDNQKACQCSRVRTVAFHEHRVVSVNLDHEGAHVISLCEDGVAKITAVHGGVTRTWRTTHFRATSTFLGSRVALFVSGVNATVWRTVSAMGGQATSRLKPEKIRQVEIAPNGKYVAISTDGSEVIIWSLPDLLELARPFAQRRIVSGVTEYGTHFRHLEGLEESTFLWFDKKSKHLFVQNGYTVWKFTLPECMGFEEWDIHEADCPKRPKSLTSKVFDFAAEGGHLQVIDKRSGMMVAAWPKALAKCRNTPDGKTVIGADGCELVGLRLESP